MALAQLKTNTAKDEFIEQAGTPRTLKAPISRKIKSLADPEAICFKLMVFGPQGSGKTHLLVELLLLGYKIGVLTTDLGGSGLITVKTQLKKLGRTDLFENIFPIQLEDAEDVKSFLKDPTKLYPDFYDYDFDFLVWDGFSSFQMNILPAMIGTLASDKAAQSNKELAEVREDGLQFEISDWGIFRNYTVRSLNNFLNINNKKTGKTIHKIVTCLEGLKGVQVTNAGMATTLYKETREPFLQGAAVKMVGPAFDLIINTRVEVDNKQRKFKYVITGNDQPQGPKTRFTDLPPEMEADMGKLWPILCEQLDLKVGRGE